MLFSDGNYAITHRENAETEDISKSRTLKIIILRCQRTRQRSRAQTVPDKTENSECSARDSKYNNFLVTIIPRALETFNKTHSRWEPELGNDQNSRVDAFVPASSVTQAPLIACTRASTFPDAFFTRSLPTND